MGILLFQHFVSTSPWLLLPFGLLLCMIATGPVLFPRFWHDSYHQVAPALGGVVGVWYIFAFNQPVVVAETFSEYTSFISLLFALYAVSESMAIQLNIAATPRNNVLFLLTGALLSNVLGTMGASVLLIRPFMSMNRSRLKPYLIVFFIFLVSNIGGSLTPIGDPPLLMGYLRGVPFFWTFRLFPLWLLVMALLLTVFYFLDRRHPAPPASSASNALHITGGFHLLWLPLVIGSIFLSPVLLPGLPVISYGGKSFSFIRELIQLSIGVVCLLIAKRNKQVDAQINLEPIKEVAYLFFGLFLTMIPAIAWMEQQGASGLHLGPAALFFASGFCSSLLDNAPAYINFATLALSAEGFNILNPAQVGLFAADHVHSVKLIAISTGCVFWGAMTYIGNGPNFMVKSIAERAGMEMPSFHGYLLRFGLPILLPVLLVAGVFFLF